MNPVLKSLFFTFFPFIIIICTPAKTYSEPYWIFFKREESWKAGEPVSKRLIQSVIESGLSVRTISRYFNAVSVNVDNDPCQLKEIEGVQDIKPVRKLMRTVLPEALKSSQKLFIAGVERENTFGYGDSYRQLKVLNIPLLHDKGLTGEGIVIGVLDEGFDIENVVCLKNIKIAHTRNFITGEEDVKGRSHGTYVLSCLGGACENEYYGAAFGSTYLLAVTDDFYTETRADEDRFVAAVEWCDSLGADIISSSLVYNIFDSEQESYSKQDMDGHTSLVAMAAEIAVSRGIVVVNAAGNEGNNSWGIITTPADAEHVIAVGAVSLNTNGEPIIADFSSRGPTADGRIKPDVVAFGAGVIVPYPGTTNYITQNGTSLAAPFITGLCALLLEAHPDWSPSHVMAALKESAEDIGKPGPDNDYGWGLPDGEAALFFTPTRVNTDEVSKGKNTTEESELSSIQPFILSSPYPNPFNAMITIPFRVDKVTGVTVEVVDTTGRVIKKLYNEITRPGYYQTRWYASGYSSGVYFIRATSGRAGDARKVLLIK
ncbi:MAG: S8 family serine peptidase [Candidatus Latescibacteria bacterium]|jgi:serine protease AprX|nr:S8 family serine peptidase [Candidatus Latescibacterota bacterium]